MIIEFSPVRMDETLELIRTGDTLIINGEPFDFSVVPAGGILPETGVQSAWICGPVQRDDAGVLHVPVVLPIGFHATESARFPHPASVDEDGPIALPN